MTIFTLGAVTLLSAIGAFLLGRFAVRINRLQNVAFKILLFVVVGLVGMLVAIAPVIIIALSDLGQLPPLPVPNLPNDLNELLFSAVYLVYCAVIYLSFRMGTGRVHGHG